IHSLCWGGRIAMCLRADGGNQDGSLRIQLKLRSVPGVQANIPVCGIRCLVHALHRISDGRCVARRSTPMCHLLAKANRRASALTLVSGLSALAISLVTAGAPSRAQAAGLEGSWSGGGTVRFASGAEEQARCRAHYSRRSNAVYVLRATCATASGKAAQSATL